MVLAAEAATGTLAGVYSKFTNLTQRLDFGSPNDRTFWRFWGTLNGMLGKALKLEQEEDRIPGVSRPLQAEWHRRPAGAGEPAAPPAGGR